eukprot:TRINITY_DN3216_c0_g1_i2.p1 TRINITY_DN3216_c0_g1~~TRINITY_DN3216_c0_g1_i2.p1  ORF type:complete len:386 (+),score=93.14 TRINITY_DN3216_c0_g1_i2:201-1358(+)
MFLKKVLIDRSLAVVKNPVLRSCLSTWKPLTQQGGLARTPTRSLLTASFPTLRHPSVPLFAVHTSIRRFADAAGEANKDAAAADAAQKKKTVEEQEQERINKEKEQEREKEGNQRAREKTAFGGRIIPITAALMFVGAGAYLMSQKELKMPESWNDVVVEFLSTLTDVEPKGPRLPPLTLQPNQQKQLTLIIDSSELYTPEWTDKGWIRKRRPKTHFLLTTLFQQYEIVIWHTNEWREAALQNPEFIDKLDPYRMCHHLFYEDLAIRRTKKVKDINLLGRDPANVVVLTSNPEEYGDFQNNVVKLKKWKGEAANTDLADVVFFLDELAAASPNDVRDVVSRFKNKDVPSLWRPRRLQYEQLLRQQQAGKQKTKETTKGFLGRIGL